MFFFIALKACAYWLDRYGLVFSGRGKVTGASYTDVHASLPAKTILFWIAILIALSVLASLWLQERPAAGDRLRRADRAVARHQRHLPVLHAAVHGQAERQRQGSALHPAQHQRDPAGLRDRDRHRRRPGHLQELRRDRHPDTAALKADRSRPSANLRILDPNVVSPTFLNAQQVRNVYGFADKLDIDRYTVDGQEQDYVVGVRELDQSKLTGNQTNWINMHTFYTHGLRVRRRRGQQRRHQHPRRTPRVTSRPPDRSGLTQSATPRCTTARRCRTTRSSAPRARRASTTARTGKTTYAGSGGVKLSNLFTRLGVRRQVPGERTSCSTTRPAAKGAKIIFNRDPRQRVEKVAPFLTVDGDPYPAVDRRPHRVDRRRATPPSPNYPYSERQIAVRPDLGLADRHQPDRHPVQQRHQLHPQLGQGHRRCLHRQGHAVPVGRRTTRCSRPG